MTVIVLYSRVAKVNDRGSVDMRKAISIAVCMAVSVSVFAQSSAFADEPVFSGEKEAYIVLTETEKDGKKIQSQLHQQEQN